MALARRILAAGLPANTAVNIVGDSATGITATGTTVADAFQLAAIMNNVTTTAASTGVKLLPADPGDDMYVYNAGANTLSVYGQTGESIQDGATNAAFSVAANKGAHFKKRTNTAWMAILTA